MKTVDELFALPLDTRRKDLDVFLAEAQERMLTGHEELRKVQQQLIAGDISVPDKAQAQRVLDSLWFATDRTYGAKSLEWVRIFRAMRPLPAERVGVYDKASVERALIEALGLTELATAIYVVVYLTLKDEPGTLAWRRANPGAARVGDDDARSSVG